jgi:predicted permease
MAALADLRYSIRSLARTPALAVMLVVTIALGVGANAVILSFINGLVASPLPIADRERVVSVFARSEQDGFGPVSFDEYVSFKATADAFESVGAVRELQARVVVRDLVSILSVAEATPEVFGILSLPTLKGAVISERLWADVFARRKDVRGQAIEIDGRARTVTDVAPGWLVGLYAGRPVDVWVPFNDEALANARGSRTLWTMARIKPDISVRRAESRVNAARQNAAQIAVRRYDGAAPDVAGGLARISKLLPAAAIIVFVIACANVAGFLLSRGSGRAHETSVRVALGASRKQLSQQLLADSVVIAVAGGVFGGVAAIWAAHILPVMLYQQDAEQMLFAPDLVSIVLSAVVCVTLTALCGLAPLFEVRDDDPAAVLRRESGGLSNAARKIRAGLVVGQMTCCCLLLISTGLLFAGFRTAMRTSLANQLGWPIVSTVKAKFGFDKLEVGLDYFRRAEVAALAVPGISSASWVSDLPGGRPVWQQVQVELPPAGWRDVMMTAALFPPDRPYVVNVPPKAGRMFGGRDAPGGCKVAMVNKEAAAEYFDGDPVGRSVQDSAGDHIQIVGVIDTRLRTDKPDAIRKPTLYYYAEQSGLPPPDDTGLTRFKIPLRTGPLSVAVLASSVVSANYFNVIDVKPTDGKLFRDDISATACRVGMLNPEAAELYFGGNAVGGALIEPSGRRTEIVGVVPSPLLRTTQRQSAPALYLPMAQNYLARMTMVLGARSAKPEQLAAVRSALGRVEGGEVTNTLTLDEHLARTALAPERISMLLVGACAATAMWLCLTGVFGAMSDAVRQRTREIAMRIALGAQGRRVIGQVLLEGLRLAAYGAAAGLVGSLIVARQIRQVTPASGPPAIWVWVAAPVILAVVVSLASILPARRALRTSPLVVMKDS